MRLDAVRIMRTTCAERGCRQAASTGEFPFSVTVPYAFFIPRSRIRNPPQKAGMVWAAAGSVPEPDGKALHEGRPVPHGDRQAPVSSPDRGRPRLRIHSARRSHSRSRRGLRFSRSSIKAAANTGSSCVIISFTVTVQPSAELLRHPDIPIASRWAGCFLPIRFRTVCAVNAQTWLNCYPLRYYM